MSVIGALFNDFFMNKKERFTSENMNIYVPYLKELMQYFGDWRVAQLRRRKRGDETWLKTFLAPETYLNLRSGVCGFVHFSEYILWKNNWNAIGLSCLFVQDDLGGQVCDKFLIGIEECMHLGIYNT